MIVQVFKSNLEKHAEKEISLRLPDGALVPAHFHITEVGHATRRFVDCGGVRRTHQACLLQVWVHEDVLHRLSAGKLAAVFGRVGDVIQDMSLPVEIEVDLSSATRFEVGFSSIVDGKLEFTLTPTHTDCLARGVCIPGDCGDASLPLSQIEPPGACAPGGGCC